MPKLVPTVAVTVVRDGKRVTPPIGKAFDFNADEVKAVTAQMPSAFRKPVNESAEPATDPVTTPEQRGDATATDNPQTSAKTARRKAAQADSTSKAATASDAAPKSTDGASHADEDDDI